MPIRTYRARTAHKVAVGVTAALVASLAVAGNAFANAASPIIITPLPSVDSLSAPYAVNPVCKMLPSFSTDPSGKTTNVTLEGSADSTTTRTGVLAIGTGVTCSLYNRNTNELLAEVSGSLFGPHAEAIMAPPKTISIVNYDPKLCATGNALFSDNHTETTTRCT